MDETIFEVKEENSKGNYARFIISPLAQGYGNTLGTALRRVMLTSLPGAAITQVKIKGVKHQFSTLKGMKEDVVELVLNLKKVRVAYTGEKPVKLTLSVNGPKDVTVADIKAPAGVTVEASDLVLATIAKGASLEAELQVEAGVGYQTADERENLGVGIIPMDALFTPVERVNYKVEETRVGRFTNFDKLVIDVWTTGVIEPKDAIKQSAKILVSYFNQVANPKKVEVPVAQTTTDSFGAVGKLSVEEIGIPTRVANALIKAGYETVEKLVNADKSELVKVRNLGEKSLKIVKVALQEKGVAFDA